MSGFIASFFPPKLLEKSFSEAIGRKQFHHRVSQKCLLAKAAIFSGFGGSVAEVKCLKRTNKSPCTVWGGHSVPGHLESFFSAHTVQESLIKVFLRLGREGEGQRSHLCCHSLSQSDFLNETCLDDDDVNDDAVVWRCLAELLRFRCFESLEEFMPLRIAFKFWVEGVLVAVVGVFGLVGNFLTCVVLRKMTANSNFNKLLMW